MFGLRVTVNQDAPVVAAAADAGLVLATVTAVGLLGRDTRPGRLGGGATAGDVIDDPRSAP